MSALRDILFHPIHDRTAGAAGYDRLIVVDSGPRGDDVVLRIDGGYAHPAMAEDARIRLQQHLDAVLDAYLSGGAS